MRRRQIFAAQREEEAARLAEEERLQQEEAARPKGVCRKCGQHVGTGIHAHMIHCQGNG